jgi:hypothetical protein
MCGHAAKRDGRALIGAPLHRQPDGAGLTDLSDASHFHDRGFLLPVCKPSSLVTVRVHASKSLAVLVKHSRLPVMMFSPLVFSV